MLQKAHRRNQSGSWFAVAVLLVFTAALPATANAIHQDDIITPARRPEVESLVVDGLEGPWTPSDLVVDQGDAAHGEGSPIGANSLALESESSDASAGWGYYEDPYWGFGIMAPASWQERVAFENGLDKPPGIIRKRVNFKGPNNALVSAEVWQNTDGLALMDWIDTYQRRVLELGEAAVPVSPNAVISGYDAVAVSQPETCSSPAILSAYVSSDDRVFRIQYAASDGGDALDTFRRMLASFELRPITEMSRGTDTEDSVSFEVAPGSLRVLTPSRECHYADNSEGCCDYPQIWHWQCSEDASGTHRGNCTYWAAYRRQDILGHFTGSAGQWADNAKTAGFPVDSNPKVGDVMVSEGGGHVAYVTGVTEDRVEVTEMNWCTQCPENTADYPVSGMLFIHPKDDDCPQSGGVILYKGANYDCDGEGEGSGYVMRSSSGWENVPGTFNDDASSLRVPAGWSVRLYEHVDRDGNSVCLNSDDQDFSDDAFPGGLGLNNTVSSFEVFPVSDCGMGEKNVDVVLIIDSTGSMDRNDPSEMRLEAAKVFINNAKSGDRIAIVSFDTDAETLAHLRTVTDAPRTELMEAVDEVDNSGGTCLDAGLQEGYNELLAAIDDGRPKAAVFLTDGTHESCGHPYDPQNHTQYGDNGWPVYTVGLGDGVSEGLLKQMANETGGKYRHLDEPGQLQTVYYEINEKIGGGKFALEETIHMTQGSSANLATRIRGDQSSASFFAAWKGSEVSLELQPPTGPRIGPSTTDPNVFHAKGATYELYRVRQPEPGLWTLSLFGTSLPPGGEEVDVRVAVQGPEYVYLPAVVNRHAEDVGRDYPQADVNRDCIVDDEDGDILKAHYGETGEPGWIRADINRDGSVDVRDAHILLNTHGETCSTETLVVHSLPEDGEVGRVDCPDWTSCRSAGYGSFAWSAYPWSSINAHYWNNDYVIKRTFLRFDTSALPASALVVTATLHVYSGEDQAGCTRLHLVRADQGETLSTDDFDQVSFESGGSADFPRDAWVEIQLNKLGATWVDTAEVTELALISEVDLNNTVPTEENGASMAMHESGALKPYLSIDYAP